MPVLQWVSFYKSNCNLNDEGDTDMERTQNEKKYMNILEDKVLNKLFSPIIGTGLVYNKYYKRSRI